MKIIGVYILTDSKTGKFYIGSSDDVKKRIERHFDELRRNVHHNANFQAIWNGIGEIVETILPTETREDAYALEQDIITRYKDSNKCLNIGLAAIGGDNLTRNPNRDDIIARIKESCAKKISSMTTYERKLLWGLPGKKNGMWGKTHTTEVREMIGNLHRGNQYNLGRRFSDEHRKKISEHAQQRTGEKNPFFGRQHSDETKRKLSEQRKGNVPTNARKMEIGGKVYESLTEASRQLGVSPALIVYRLKKGKEGYRYLT